MNLGTGNFRQYIDHELDDIFHVPLNKYINDVGNDNTLLTLPDRNMVINGHLYNRNIYEEYLKNYSIDLDINLEQSPNNLSFKNNGDIFNHIDCPYSISTFTYRSWDLLTQFWFDIPRNPYSSFPYLLSFWCYPNLNTVFVFTSNSENLTPMYLKKIEFARPTHFQLFVNSSGVFALVLTSGDNAISLYKLDPKIKFIKKANCSKSLKSPSGFAMISLDTYNKIYLILDMRSNCIILLDGKLDEIDVLCNDKFPEIQQPSSVSCVQREGVIMECFIIQTFSNSLLRVQVNKETKKMSIAEYFNGGDNQNLTPLLRYPLSVIAFSYNSIVFIYLIEVNCIKYRLGIID